MKLSISNIAWLKKTDDNIASILASHSIKHIDVAPLLSVDTIDSLPDEFLLFWKGYDITPLGMQSLFYGKNDKFFIDETSLLKTTKYFRRVAILAKKMGVTALVFGSPKQRSLENGFVSKRKIVNFFHELAVICEAHEMSLCLEPNAFSYGTNFLNTTSDTIRFIDEVSHPFLKLNFDTGTIMMNGLDPVKVYQYAHHHIGHIHISSPNLKPIDSKMFDHKKLRNMLIAHRYNKGIAVEMLTKDRQREKNILAALEVLEIYNNEV